MHKLTYKHTVIACYLTYITSAVSNNLVPLLFVTFNKQFGLTLDKLAFIITMNFGIQIFVDLAGAKFADRIGYKKLVMTAQLFDAVGLAALGILPKLLPNPYAGIILSAVFYAIGSGLTEVVISPIVEAIPNDGSVKASAMSFLHSFYCWGQVLMVVVTTLFFKIFGVGNWSVICCLWAILPLVNFVFCIFVPIAQLNDNDQDEPLPLGKLFTVKILWVFMLLMLCAGAAEQSMSQWASFFAETELGVSKQAADLLGPCMFAAAMGTARVLFAALKKLDIRAGLLISSVLCIISYLIAAFAPSFLALAGCTLCGFSVGILWPGVLSLSAKTYKAGGTAMFAILALFGDVGCFVGPEAVARFSTALAGTNEPSVKAGLMLAIVFPLCILLCTFALLAAGRKEENP